MASPAQAASAPEAFGQIRPSPLALALIAAGSAGMAEAPDSGNYVQVNVSAPAGATIEVRSGDTVIATYTTIKAVANVVVASDHIVSGQSYTVTVNGSTTATVTAGQATGGGMGGGPRG